jgi:hypothetical protein
VLSDQLELLSDLRSETADAGALDAPRRRKAASSRERQPA